MHFGCSLDFHNVLPGSVMGVLYAPCVTQGGARNISADLPERRLYPEGSSFLIKMLTIILIVSWDLIET